MNYLLKNRLKKAVINTSKQYLWKYTQYLSDHIEMIQSDNHTNVMPIYKDARKQYNQAVLYDFLHTFSGCSNRMYFQINANIFSPQKCGYYESVNYDDTCLSGGAIFAAFYHASTGISADPDLCRTIDQTQNKLLVRFTEKVLQIRPKVRFAKTMDFFSTRGAPGGVDILVTTTVLMQPVDSSSVDSIGYNEGKLYVCFLDGRTDEYYNVSEDVYNSMVSSSTFDNLFTNFYRSRH